ncbi:MAG: hypothetical protein WCA44_08375, partial [Acidobacteriaceae bacterium]
MTLVEFVATVRKGTARDKCLAVLYYLQTQNGQQPLTAEQIKNGLKAARIPRAAKVNVSDVLSKSGHLVDSPGVNGRRLLWTLTDSGRKYVRAVLGLAAANVEAENDATTLEALAAGLSDETVRDYVIESIKCLRADAFRAAIVFLWAGAIRVLQDESLQKGATALNAAILKHDPK